MHWLIPFCMVSRSEFLGHSFSAVGFLVADNNNIITCNIGDSSLKLKSSLFRDRIHQLVSQDPSIAGPLVRLAFHDAITFDIGADSGPNASIQWELGRFENRGLAKPLQLIRDQMIRDNMILDISLADAIALAGAEAIESVGGPQIPIRMGRVDASVEDAEFLHHSLQGSTTRSIVTKTLPSAGLDSDGLRFFFRRRFTDPEWIALVGGSHGLGRHVSLLGMSKPCLKNLTRTCLEDAPVLLPFVTESVNRFDNTYFRALLDWNTNNVELGQVAFIPTDVAMVVDRGDVQTFAYDSTYFRRNFVTGYQKLVDLSATSLERY
jgi:L-ascorbate peroxidase